MPSLQIADVAAVAPGKNGTCVLQTDGIVRCWGDGSTGLLGTGNAAGDDTPRLVSLGY